MNTHTNDIVRSLQANMTTMMMNMTAAPTTSPVNAPTRNFNPFRRENEEGGGQNVLQFIGFLAWYSFLVLCCALPTILAFRRRRQYERRMQRQLHLQQQRALNPELFIHDVIVEESEEDRKEREAKIREAIKATTMDVKASDLIEPDSTDSNNDTEPKLSIDEENTKHEIAAAVDEEVSSTIMADIEVNDWNENGTTALLKLGDVPNGNRTVPASCAICLCKYEPDDQVTHSPNVKCVHAFHEPCIVQWLVKKKQQPHCPCCRQEFIPPSEQQVSEQPDGQESEDDHPYFTTMEGMRLGWET